jgi:hypothetical protein
VFLGMQLKVLILTLSRMLKSYYQNLYLQKKLNNCVTQMQREIRKKEKKGQSGVVEIHKQNIQSCQSAEL